jgi:hypothetical protein
MCLKGGLLTPKKGVLWMDVVHATVIWGSACDSHSEKNWGMSVDKCV